MAEKRTLEVQIKTSGIEQAKSQFEGFGKTLIGANLATQAIQKGLQELGNFVKDSVNVASQYQASLVGLSFAAATFRNETDTTAQAMERANSAAKILASDGLISVQTASSGLRNLLQGGLNIDQATEMMRAYINEASLFRSSNISLNEAVDNLSFSFVSENSMIGNLSGQTENYNYIVEQGAAALGKKANELSATERAQAKYIGTLQVAEKAQGGAAMMANTYQGQLSKLGTITLDLKNNIGSALQPALLMLMSVFTDNVSLLNQNKEAFEGLAKAAIYTAATIRTALAIIIAPFEVLYNLLTGKGIGGAIDNLVNRVAGASVDMKTALDNVGKSVVSGIERPIQNLGNTIDDTNSETQKKLLDLTERFKESMFELVWASTDRKNKAIKDLNEETKAFKESMSERVASFNESMEEMTKDHDRKVADILLSIERENADWITKRQKLTQDIENEEKKGSYIAGYWNSKTNRDRLDDLKDTLKQEGIEHDRKLTDLQTKLQRENQDYRQSSTQKKTMFAEETAKAKSEHTTRVSDLNSTIKKEQGLEKQYQSYFGEARSQGRKNEFEKLIANFNKEKSEYQKAGNTAIDTFSGAGLLAGEGFGYNMGSALEALNTDSIGSNIGKGIVGGIEKEIMIRKAQLKARMYEALADIGISARNFGTSIFAGAEMLTQILSGNIYGAYQTAQKYSGGNGGWKHGGVIPAYAHGGLTPGMSNTAIPAILHGGERIIPREGSSVNNTNNNASVNIYGTVNVRDDKDIDKLARKIAGMMGRSNELARFGIDSPLVSY